MGARGNIKITHGYNSETPIFLYTHWAGGQINEILSLGVWRAFEKGRLTDPSYATRIIFDTLTEGSDDPYTGFGISIGKPDDNNYDIPHLAWPAKFGAEPVIELNGQTYDWREFLLKFGDRIRLSAVSSGQSS